MAALNYQESGDPFDWSIDQVVYQFCQNPRPIWAPDKPRHLPAPALLEKALRDNDLDGENILALDDSALKQDIGITSFGQRRTFLKAIFFLRNISRKYQQPSFHADALARLNSGAFATPQMTASLVSPFAQSSGISGYVLPPGGLQQGLASPGFNNYADLARPLHPMSQSNTLLLQATASPRLQTTPRLPGPDAIPIVSAAAPYQSFPAGDQEHELSNLTDDTTFLSSNSHLRDDTGNDSLEVPAAEKPQDRASLSATLNAQEHVPRQLLGRSGTAEQHSGQNSGSQSRKKYTIVDGRRRLAPTFVSKIPEAQSNQQQNVATVKVDADLRGNQLSSFLYESAQSIPDIIYHLPKEVESDEFSFGPSNHPPGQTKHIAAVMKHALLQSAKIVPGSRAKYKFLYPKSYSSYSDDPQYFTLFAPGADPVVRDVNEWPAMRTSFRTCRRKKDDIKELPARLPAANDFVEEDVTTDLELADYQYLLDKYPVLPDDRDILPEYGDSGDEGEFDEETWREIDAEYAERRQEKDKGFMTQLEVEQAIDEAIAELKAQWRDEKFPKAQVKAYRLWGKAAKHGQRDAEKSNAEFWVDRFDRGIQKIRKAIAQDVWFKPRDVKEQCKSLEESVFQREEYLCLVDILGKTHPPPRPDTMTLMRAKRKDRHSVPDGEEILESDSDMSLRDFIEDESSDVSSIAHDAPSEEVDAGLAQFREDAARARAHNVLPEAKFDQDQTSRDEFAELSSGAPRGPIKDTTLGPQSGFESDSSEDRILTSAHRKRMSTQDKSPRKVADNYAFSNSSTDSENDRTESIEDMDVDPDQDSDLDLPHLPRTKYREHGRSQLQAIDLTLSSSPSRAEMPDNESIMDFDVTTPDLNPQDQKEPRPKLKLTSRAMYSHPDSDASSPRLVLNDPSDTSHLAGLENVHEIQQLGWDDICAESDRRRALAKAVYSLDLDLSKGLRKYVTDTLKDHQKLRERLRDALLRLNQKQPIGQKSPHLQALPLLFITYVCHANMMDETEITQEDLQDAWQSLESAHQKFYACLILTLNAYCRYVPDTRSSKKRKSVDPEPQDDLEDNSDPLAQTTDSDVPQIADEPSSHKRRKREVKESQEAKFQQLNDQQRVMEEEARKALVAKKLLAMDVTGDDPSTKVINTREPFITLDPHIGKRVKPHQIEGISFMWREIVTDPKQQGCLLAHTMGLGKTMQVISLLCTIAQSGSSPDPAIRQQVPEDLHHLRALILCPPSLIDNWYDELLMWIPVENLLGTIYKISSKTTRVARFQAIRAWGRTDSVLLLSYDMFRNYISKPPKNGGKEEYLELQDILLNGPNIIVADEAHKMKNASSKISIAAKRFKSFSRIALTGSPLNNYLEEYHTMVDWIAPGYLGTIVQFRAKYSEPISEGLYYESTPYERRIALRKLHVLKRDLDPKINRADISAVANDMPSKTEFFVTVPLTPLQERAYNILMDHILQPSASATTNAWLWSWIDIIKLLCNHPSCFVQKLEKLNDGIDSAQVPKESAANDDDDLSEAREDATPSDPGFSTAVAAVRERAIQVFDELDWSDMVSFVELSHRALIVKQIIEEARRIGDKVLLFSHSIPTLDYLEKLIDDMGCEYARIDGKTTMSSRQETTKVFNSKAGSQQVFLISMRAGGLGLNLPGANRVVIFDFSWNPSWEEQAIGRAYRLGQKKPVFVYRFRAGGTYEDVLYNKAVFKTQLFERVVDSKNYYGRASKSVTEYLFHTRDVPVHDFSETRGKDPEVLDRIIDRTDCIRNIELTETFQKEEDLNLTLDEQKAADEEYYDQVLERDDPEAYRLKKIHQQQQMLQQAALVNRQSNNQLATPSANVSTTIGGGSAMAQTGMSPSGGSNILWSASNIERYGGIGSGTVFGQTLVEDDADPTPATIDMSMRLPPRRANSEAPPRLPQMEDTEDMDGMVQKPTSRDECAPQ